MCGCNQGWQYAPVDDRSSSMSLGDPRLLKSYSYGDVLVRVVLVVVVAVVMVMERLQS